MDMSKLFFVLGYEKSGTTWMVEILNNHPKILCTNEARWVPVIQKEVHRTAAKIKEVLSRRSMGGLKTNCPSRLSTPLLQATILQFYEEFKREVKPEAIWVGDKTPEHTQWIPTLELRFEQPRYILLVRDGRDCCVSLWARRDKNSRLRRVKDKYPTLTDFADYHSQDWTEAVGTAVDFAEHNPERVLIVRYEDMLVDLPKAIREVYAFVTGEVPSDALTRQVADKLNFKAITGRDPGDSADEFRRKGIAGDYLNVFSEAVLDAYKKHAAPLLRRLGYSC